MPIQKYTSNLYKSEVYRELERQAARKGFFEPTEAERVKIASTQVAQKTAVNKPIDASPSDDLVQDIARLAYAMRRKGFISQAEEVEQKLLAYKKAENEIYNVTSETNKDFIDFSHPEGDVQVIPGAGELGVVETIESAAEKIRAVTRKEPSGKLPGKKASLSEIAKIVTAQVFGESTAPVTEAQSVQRYLKAMAGLYQTVASDEINFSSVLSPNGTGNYMMGKGDLSALFNMLSGNQANAVLRFGGMANELFGGKPPVQNGVPGANINTVLTNNLVNGKDSYLGVLSKYTGTKQASLKLGQAYSPYAAPGVDQAVQQMTQEQQQKAQQEQDLAKQKADPNYWKGIAPQYVGPVASSFTAAANAAYSALNNATTGLNKVKSDAAKIAAHLNERANQPVENIDQILTFVSQVKRDVADLKNQIMWPARVLNGFGKKSEAAAFQNYLSNIESLVKDLDTKAQNFAKIKESNKVDPARTNATVGRLRSVRTKFDENSEIVPWHSDTAKEAEDMENLIRTYAPRGWKALRDALKPYGDFETYNDFDKMTMQLDKIVSNDIAAEKESA